jgi:hypothetical protein
MFMPPEGAVRGWALAAIETPPFENKMYPEDMVASNASVSFSENIRLEWVFIMHRRRQDLNKRFLLLCVAKQQTVVTSILAQHILVQDSS